MTILEMNAIEGFFGDFRFLSNFHFVDVVFNGQTYRTTEHAYQAAKTLDEYAKSVIRDAASPKIARKLGQLVVYRPDWDEIKLPVMLELTQKKFANEPLRTMLLDTGDKYLEETNTWNDTYWGVCQGVGTNHLGIILMQVRDEIRRSGQQ
jgi:ribA/ribD-fused uncharacterized protein